jgi:hypothetical protein
MARNEPYEIDEPLGAHLFVSSAANYELAQIIPLEPEAGLGCIERLELRDNARVVERFIQRNHEFQELYRAIYKASVSHILEANAREHCVGPD